VTAAPVVRLAGVTKRFGGRAVVAGLDLEVAAGAVLALLGPSGCGKSTTLRLIAGLESVDAGTIWLDGEEVSAPGRLVAPDRRRVGFVFQSFALFPHLSVAQNVAFGARDAARADELLALVRLEARRAARVHELSGGEQQRVALARALAMAPRVVLLDEPFANLDAALRRHVRDEVAHALRARGATAILVTHDAAEAFALADRVAVLADGALLQLGAPEEVYARPTSLEVAARTGEVVTIAGRWTATGAVATALGELQVAAGGPPAPGAGVLAMARPEQLAIEPGGAPARVVRRVFEGATTLLELELERAAGVERAMLRAPGALPGSVRAGEVIPVGVRGPVCAFAAPPGLALPAASG
jgi:iron(III) transport system ATP-binding protein